MAQKQSQQKKLFGELESVLTQTDRSFLTGFDPKVHGPVYKLREIIWAVENLRGRQRLPVPFWICVQRVDADWPEIRLMARLNEMLDRAFKILCPSPWASLRKRFKTQAYRQERAQVETLIEHFVNTGSEPPEGLESYWQLFMGLDLRHLGSMAVSVTPATWAIETKRIFAYACYLNLCCANSEWEESIRPILDQLEFLLEGLESEQLNERFNEFLSERRLPTSSDLKDSHRKSLNRSRVRRHRGP